jgi:hypothetical protein
MDHAEARKIHDALLADMPEGADHDGLSCGFCSPPVTEQTASAEAVVDEVRREEPRMEPIHTQEAADALIESAVAKALAEVKANHEQEVAKLNESLEEAKAEVAKLQEARDADQIALAAKEEELSSVKAEIAKRDEEEARAQRIDARVAEVASVHKFSDEYVASNKERWADMDEAAFAVYVESIKDMASHIKPAETAEVDETKVPEETAMSNVRDDAGRQPARAGFFSALKGGSN